jgi:hypothetical protein
MLNNITNYANLIDNGKVRTLLQATDLFTIGVRDANFYGHYQPALITTTDLVSSIAGLLPAPPIVDEVINFNQLTPTTPGVVFNPDTPGLTNVLYVSSVDTSTWIWNGTSYQTVSIANNTAWYLAGTTIDAGGSKSASISRNNAIYTIGYDSFFNSVRVGRGNNNIATNTVVGSGAGNTISTGSNNTFNGSQSGRFNSIGANNSFYGVNSGFYNSGGSDNINIGNSSGVHIANGTTSLTKADKSVFLGANTKALANNQTNQIVIGYDTIGYGSNTVTIGNGLITDTYIQGTPHINNTWTLPITVPTAGKVLGYSAPGVSDWVSSSGANLQKEITATYVLTDADDDYTIFVNNGATAISISLGAITVPNFSVGFIQQGTADVSFVGVMTNPVGLKSKGQGYQTFIERKLATSTYYLLGNTKA